MPETAGDVTVWLPTARDPPRGGPAVGQGPATINGEGQLSALVACGIVPPHAGNGATKERVPELTSQNPLQRRDRPSVPAAHRRPAAHTPRARKWDRLPARTIGCQCRSEEHTS